MNHIKKELPGQSAEGRVKVMVVENGCVVEERPWQKNLILDQGLNLAAGTNWCDCFASCAAGTDNTPVLRDSGGITATQSGNTVTASSSFFVLGDIGKLIHFDSGQDAMITGFTDGLNVTVSVSQTVGAGQFTVWYVNQTGLGNEQKRNNAYLTGSGNCGSSIASNTLTHRRTFDFSAETGSVVYTELGWSNSGSAGNNLFSRVLLSSSVTVLSGQQLRVVYDLSVTLTPNTTQTGTASISGWPVSPATGTTGSYGIQQIGLSAVNTSGGTVSWDSGGVDNEPSSAPAIYLSSDTTAVQAFGSSAGRGTNQVAHTASLASYVNGNFYRDKFTTFAVGEANRTDWRSMGLGNTFVFVFDENQTKTNTNTLLLTFRSTWGRKLVNP
jgi:hypothetical protein